MCALETAALELLPANPPNSSANAGSASNGPKDPKGIFSATQIDPIYFFNIYVHMTCTIYIIFL